MEEAGKKQDRRKGMKRWKEKKSSRSSGTLDSVERQAVPQAKDPRQTPKGHARSSSGSLSNRSGVVNFSVPPLQLDVPTKKVSSTGKKLRSHKGNAGFKSRCTDQERWHQYLVDEGNFREPNFACPFFFVGRTPKKATASTAGGPGGDAAKEGTPGAAVAAPAPATPAEEAAAQAPAGSLGSVPQLDSFDKSSSQRTAEGESDAPKSPERAPAAPSPKGSPKKSKKEYIKRQPSLLREMCLYAPRTLSMLSDNVTVVNNVVQYQSLEQFGVKKFNIAEMTEWEVAIKESIERHFLEKDKGRSLKNKVRDKSLGVISSGTPRSRSRPRATSDADRKPSGKGTPQKGGVSSKEIQYGGLRTSINPLLLLDGQERSRSITHKPRSRPKRASTGLERPMDPSPTASPAGSDFEESGDSFSDSSAKAASAPPSPTREEEPVPQRITMEKKERKSIIHLISGAKSPRRSAEEDQHALPKRSSSAKSPQATVAVSPMSSPSSSSKLESLLGIAVVEQPQHFIPAGSGRRIPIPRKSLPAPVGMVTAADTVKSEEDEASVAKSISPLRLFSPRKKGKRAPLTTSGGSDESPSPVTTPKGDQGKKKRPGYFQSLKMQLKTPRGAKAKDDEESQAHPRKRKSRTPKTKKPKDLVIQRIDSAAMVSPSVSPTNGSLPSSPTRDSDSDVPLARSPHGTRPYSASFEPQNDGVGTGMVDALVDSRVRPSAAHRLSLPVRRTQSRGGSSKSDTEAGLLRSPGGVRFDVEELNPPSDGDED